MPTINFNSLFSSLETGVANLAKTTVKQYATQAEADGKGFLTNAKSDLQTWTDQLAKGEISKDDFSDLLLGQKDLLALTALKQVGLSEIALDNFKNGIFNLIETTVFSVI